MLFADRFALLQESGQVSAAAVDSARVVLAGVSAYLGRPLEEEGDGAMATHLVLALERMAADDHLPDPPDVVLEEAKTYESEWGAASALLEEAARRWGRSAPLAEIVYLTVHIRSRMAERT